MALVQDEEAGAAFASLGVLLTVTLGERTMALSRSVNAFFCCRANTLHNMANTINAMPAKNPAFFNRTVFE